MSITKGPINILIMNTVAGVGGAERIVYYIIKFLDRKKYTPYVITGADGPLMQELKEYNVVLNVLPLQSIKGIFWLFKLIKFIRHNKIDLIHAQGARIKSFGCFASLCTGVPIFTVEQNIDDWRKGHYLRNLIDKMCSIIEVKRVGVAPMVTDMLVKKVGIPRDKTVTINNAIDLSSFDYNQNCSDLRKTFGIPDSHKIVGVVGRLEPQKGHIFFMQAAHEILSQCSNISFLIVGDGILKQKLVEMTKEFNQERKIYFTGIRKDIPQLLSIIDIYVMPSLWEGLPLALLEAMAMEKPIVATRVGGIQDVVEDGKDALLVPPGDSNALAEKVIFLLKRPELCLTLGTNAREKVEKKYNAELMVKEYEETYGDILFR